jgi:RNA polymerase sigma factor (sigma-70 family)
MTFVELYHSYKNLVYNLAMQYVQSIEDAEEITQDVFLKIYDNMGGFKSQSTLKTWIYRIAINQSLDFIKAKQSQKRSLFFGAISLDHDLQKVEITVKSHPGIILEQKEALERIFHAINKLADQQKTVIILLKIEQKSINETAEIMDLTYKAVESLYQRAKNNLQEILKNEGIQ